MCGMCFSLEIGTQLLIFPSPEKKLQFGKMSLLCTAFDSAHFVPILPFLSRQLTKCSEVGTKQD